MTADRVLKVIVWTTGPNGRNAARQILERSDMQLVGVKAYSAAKHGKDAGELINRPPTGVIATSDDAELLALDADCVLYCPNDSSLADPSVEGTQAYDHLLTMLALLRSGKNVVSMHCGGTHPRAMKRGDWFLEVVNKACAEGGSSLHYTGVDPGFITDALPIILASSQFYVKQITTWEVLDYLKIATHTSMYKLGYGRKAEEVAADTHDWVVQTWGGVPHLLADAFGITLDGIEVDCDFWLAPERIVAPNGYVVEQGTVAGYYFAQHGVYQGRKVFTTKHVNRFGPDTFPDLLKIGHNGGYRIEIDGRVPFSVDMPLGNPGGSGTAFADAGSIASARMVNMAWPVVLAEPGYRTVLDLSCPRPALHRPPA